MMLLIQFYRIETWKKLKINGQAGIFAEGLVCYQSKCFLYYGTADSYAGVAIEEWSTVNMV